MNRTISKLMLAMLISASACVAKAQVTIGLNEEPSAGALLDLKERAPSGTDNSTANNGLLFPRVNLTDKNNLYPMFENNGSGGYKKGAVPYVKADEDKSHTGLVVYNLSDAGDFAPGLYAWDGTEWTTCKCGDDGPIVDPGNLSIQTVFKGGIIGPYSPTPEYQYNRENFFLETPDKKYKIYLSGAYGSAANANLVIVGTTGTTIEDKNVTWNAQYTDNHSINAAGADEVSLSGLAIGNFTTADGNTQRTYIWTSRNENIKVVYKAWVTILSKYANAANGTAKVVFEIQQYTWTY